MLFQLGAVQFTVAPVNVQEVERETGGDFAPKDIMGAQRPREFVGPADEKVVLGGTLFPERFGLGSFSALEAMAQTGEPQMLVRGDGTVFGWYLIERVKERHSFLNPQGVGRKVQFDIALVKSPTGPSVGAMFSTILSLLG